uniref:RING-type E3 ubiquitin transferase n=1 Tax=Cairina moschata TaxID=8855 RepID=A0A8C3BF88_CAIMO
MASALDERCPICLDTWSNAGYVLPCLHRFCFKCIHRWAERKPKCPLCKGRPPTTKTLPGKPNTIPLNHSEQCIWHPIPCSDCTFQLEKLCFP